MDYERIIGAAYDGFSIRKALWFMVFFWLAFPVLVVVPWALSKQVFTPFIAPAVILLYDLMYFLALIGFIMLTREALGKKNLPAQDSTMLRVLATIALVFVELFYVFVWHLGKKTYRYTQLLLLVGMPLLLFYVVTSGSLVSYGAFMVFACAYVLVVLYNAVRLVFTMMVFYNKNVTIYDAPKEAWALTEHRFVSTAVALMFGLGTVVILFFLVSIVLAVVANIALSLFFIGPISYDLALKAGYLFALAPALVCYYSAISEIYAQLVRAHTSSSHVKKLLARKVLAKGFAKRSFAKKATKKSAKKRK